MRLRRRVGNALSSEAFKQMRPNRLQNALAALGNAIREVSEAIEEMRREAMRFCLRFLCSVTQAFEAIMRGFDFAILILDNLAHRRRQTFLQRVSVFFDG